MATESASFISQLDAAKPGGGEQRALADDYLRLLKTVLIQSFPNVNGECSASAGEFNQLVGIKQNIQNAIDDISAGYRSAISALSATLDTQVETLSATLNAKIDGEISARAVASAALDAKIETLSAALSTSSATLNAKIDGEISARAVSSAALDTKIENLSATLNTKINGEISARAVSSAALDAKIETLSAVLHNSLKMYVSLASMGVSMSASSTVNKDLIWKTIVDDAAGVFNTATAAITIPSGFKWARITANTKLSGPEYPWQMRLYLTKNGTLVAGGFDVGSSWIISNVNFYYLNGVSAYISAPAGTVFKVGFEQDNSAGSDVKIDNSSWVSVELIAEGG